MSKQKRSGAAEGKQDYWDKDSSRCSSDDTVSIWNDDNDDIWNSKKEEPKKSGAHNCRPEYSEPKAFLNSVNSKNGDSVYHHPSNSKKKPGKGFWISAAAVIVCLCLVAALPFIKHPNAAASSAAVTNTSSKPLSLNPGDIAGSSISVSKNSNDTEKLYVSLDSQGRIQQKNSFPETASWDNLVSVELVSDCYAGILALREDGRLLCTDFFSDSFRNEISSWTDIVSFNYSNYECIVAVNSRGKVLSYGFSSEISREVSSWSGIVQAVAMNNAVVGLKADGTLIAADSSDESISLNELISKWDNIVSITADFNKLAGLKNDGTVVALGCLSQVYNWHDIIKLSANTWGLYGLTNDGKVLFSNNESGFLSLTNEVPVGYTGQDLVDNWSNIKDFSAGYDTVAAIKNDGSIVTNFTENACRHLNLVHYNSIYRDFIDSLPLSQREDSMFSITLYDIDGNGIPELILGSGDSAFDSEFNFYTINKNSEKVESLGSCHQGYAYLAPLGSRPGLIIDEAQQGSEYISICTLENGSLKFATIREASPIPVNSPWKYESGEPGPIPFVFLNTRSYSEYENDKDCIFFGNQVRNVNDNLLIDNAEIFSLSY